jgi:TolB-like protein
MFTDIVGYTALMGSDEDRAFEILSKNREIHTQLIEKYNGTLIKEMGDGMLIRFDLASDAVYCAIEIQKKCKEQDIPLKIGVHEGELVFEGADVIGDAVNVASRLESGTQTGCISISGSVYHDIKNRSDIQTKFIKEKRFKNVYEPIKVYEILCEVIGDQSKSDQKSFGKINRKSVILIIGVLALFGAIFIVWKMIPASIAVEMDKSIAVLPFKNLSPDNDNQYYCDGQWEAVQSKLSRLSGLQVTSTQSTEQYRSSILSIRQIAKDLGVNYLVQGSLQKYDDKIRIIVKLINAKTDVQIWAEEYTREESDIFSLQNEIALHVANALSVKLSILESKALSSEKSIDPEVYDTYLSAKNQLRKFFKTRDPSLISSASSKLFEVIEKEPNYADAYLDLANCYRVSRPTFPRSDSSMSLVQKAVVLEPDNATAHYVLGIYYMYHNYNPRLAVQEYNRARELNERH